MCRVPLAREIKRSNALKGNAFCAINRDTLDETASEIKMVP